MATMWIRILSAQAIVIYLLFVADLASARVVSCSRLAKEPWITAGPTEGRQGWDSIPHERFVVVPVATKAEAIRILEKTPLVRLKPEELRRLFPMGAPDGSTLSRAAIARFEAEAARREREARMDSFSKNPNFLKWAAEQRLEAEKERSGLNMLVAYLARGVLANSSGRFSGDALENKLWIYNGALGCPWPEKAPVVVFVDRDINELFVSISKAL